MKLKVKTNAQDWVKYLTVVTEKTQTEVENRLPTLRQNTKKVVKKPLSKAFGVDEGIYKRSFIINNFDPGKWKIGFQVFAKKPHYRLTHLLEGNERGFGHKTILFRRGKGRPTHKTGAKGMTWVLRTKNKYKGNHPLGWTRKIKHIEPGQQYAERKIVALYEKAINNNLERMRW